MDMEKLILIMEWVFTARKILTWPKNGELGKNIMDIQINIR